jgi:hypothetical protein
MDLGHALTRHAEWKLTFRAAIARRLAVDADAVAADRCCELGRWLHGDANARYARLGTYAACVTRHAAFHVEAGKVARTINARQYAEAEAMLGAGTPYAAASSAVGAAIIGLKKEATL